MTASITHCWKKRLERTALWLAGLLLCGAALAGGIAPQSASLVPDERGLALNAEFAIDLGPRLEEAVGRGVPLNFRFEFDLKRKRWYWADEHITGRILNYKLGYQALTRQYRLSVDGLHQNFDSLADALQALGRIAQLHVVDKGTMLAGETYFAAVRLSLDHNQLPKPLQVDALADRDWRVEAKILRWSFVPASSGSTAKEGEAGGPPRPDKSEK
jgi:hypothetical protein